MHHFIRDNIAPPLECVLKSAGILTKGSKVEIEPKGVIPACREIRPYDLSFRPTPTLSSTATQPIPYSRIGIDVTMTSPKGYAPPSRQSSVAPPSIASATAVEHLIKGEMGKLCRNGHKNTYNNRIFTGDELIGRLCDADEVLLAMAISPYGVWSPTINTLLFGDGVDLQHDYRIPISRPNAKRMLHRSVTPPCPRGIANIAFAKWKKTKSKHQYFYGNSYTCPTPRIYIQQQFGLAISTAIAMHIRNAKKGTLTSVEDEEVAIAALDAHADTPPRTVTPISPQLDRFDDATFTWAGDLGAEATVPADVRETDIFHIPQSRAASWFGSHTTNIANTT